ncbi:MAG: tandem-95 repeat protein, partial [Myxococcales bacterium]|nr:tandem-95 repeat protein [Myxococcales bacterium]
MAALLAVTLSATALAAVRDGSDLAGTDLAYQYSALSGGLIKANWDKADGATSYKLAIGTTPGGSDTLAVANVGNVSSYTALGLSLAYETRYYVTIVPVYSGTDGTAEASNGVLIAEAVSWDGKSTVGLTRGFTADWPESGVTAWYGNHYFETVNIPAANTVLVQGFGREDQVPEGVGANDARVLNPKDGWLAIHANSITVAGKIIASGRGYGGGAGAPGGCGGGFGKGGSDGLGGEGGANACGGGGGGSPGGKGGVGASRGGNASMVGAGGGGGGGCTSGYNGGDATQPGQGNSPGAAGIAATVGGNGVHATSGGGGAGGTGELGPGGGGGSGYDSRNGGGGGGGYGAGGGGGFWSAGGSGGAGGTGGARALARDAAGGNAAGPFGGKGVAGADGEAGGYRAAQANGDTTTGEELYLGSGGAGGAGYSCGSGGAGGAGGGAIYLRAAGSLIITSTGMILTNGSGGGGGSTDGTTYNGAGGAGGGILLKGATVDVAATGFQVSARGAGGSAANGGTVKMFSGALLGTVPGSNAGRVFNRQQTAPVISATVPDQTAQPNNSITLALSGYESDGQDTGAALRWYATGQNPSVIAATSGQRSSSDTLVFTPVANAVGCDNVTLTLEDSDGMTARQDVVLCWRTTNRNPSISSTPPAGATEDSPFSYQVMASDPDGDPLTYSLPVGPVGMTIDAAGLVRWVPSNADVGTRAVTVKVSDGKGGEAQQAFNLAVANVNDPPVITSTPPTVATEKSLYLYQAVAVDPDPGGDLLTWSLVSPPTGMTINPGTGLVSWTPGQASVGTSQVTVRADDGNGGVVSQSYFLTVQNVNDPPLFTSTAPLSATEDSPYTYAATGTDPDGDVLTFSLVAGPAAMTVSSGGNVQWVPTNAFVGSHGVTLRVSDGKGGEALQAFTVVVANVNDPPVITSTPLAVATENVSYFYQATAADPDPTMDSLTWSLVAPPSGMSINGGTGLLSWRPGPGSVGSVQITVRVEDGKGGVASQSYFLTVQNVNDPPAFTSAPVLAATEDSPYAYAATATDPDGDPLTFSLVFGPTGTTVSSGGSVQWLPTNAQVGSHGVTLKVGDGKGGEGLQSFTLVVANLNDAPVITSTPLTVTAEGSAYAYQPVAVDPDPTADTLSWSLVAAPSGMTINAGTGLVSWKPGPSNVGNVPITLRVEDGNGGVASQSYFLTVQNTNDSPSFTSTPPLSASEGVPYSYPATASDPDPGDTLSYSVVSGPSGLTMSASTGLVLWTPTYAQVGLEAVELKVTDAAGLKDTQRFTVAVAFRDNDADGMSDSWEQQQGLDPARNDAAEDPDGDGLTNLQEFNQGTRPRTFNGPVAPVLISPKDGEEVSG